jgi:hypothetical protein
MNCQRFEDVVSDIAREQILDVTVRGEALGHVHECRQCAIRLEDELAITLRLRNFATSFKPAGASERVKAELLSAFGELSSTGSAPAHRSRQLYWASAIAAALLIMFAVSIFQLRRARQAVPAGNTANDVAVIYETPPPPSPSSSISTTVPDQHTPVLSTPKPVLAGGHGRRGGRITNRAKPSEPVANNEIATDFMPVTSGGVANLEDGGRMVRVELPRSAMASFGLPVNMDRANERVKADVLLGVDGLAHAIRFVR